MSQAKVDKYKEEKKNRAKNLKKSKVKKVLNVLLGSAIVGMIIGFPMGKIMYNHYYEKKMESATISPGIYDYWFHEYWDMNYGEQFTSNQLSNSDLTDEQIQTLVDELSSNSDAVILTPDDIDQEALEEAVYNASSTDAD